MKNKRILTVICAIFVVFTSFYYFSFYLKTGSETESFDTYGCTTILAGKKATADGSVILGHNEDMGTLSGKLLYIPPQKHRTKTINVNYVTIPQVPETYGFWGSGNSVSVAEKHYDGGWILNGMNENGVSYGCNTVFTREESIPRGNGILRYSIRRLILERSGTAREAVYQIGSLIDEYGQSESTVAYCVADRNEAWLVETTFRHWIAKRIPDDSFHVIANQYTIETEYDLISKNMIKYAEEQGWYDPAKGPFNFKYIYSDPKYLDHPRNTSREKLGEKMLRDKTGSITVRDMLKVLEAPPIQGTGTQAYMVWHLKNYMPVETGSVMWHGMSGANTSLAVPVFTVSSRVPEEYTDAPYEYDTKSAWWRFESLQKSLYHETGKYADSYGDIRKELDIFQEKIFKKYTGVMDKAINFRAGGENQKAAKLLSDFTYDQLAAVLKEAGKVEALLQK